VSLDWKLNKIDNYKEYCYKASKNGDGVRLTYLTEMMILLTMHVGINEITERNCVEFYSRVNMFERVNGCFLRRKDRLTEEIADTPITYEQVRMHVGMHTNASSLTKSRFNKALWSRVDYDINREVRNHAKAGERQDGITGGGRQAVNP